MLVRRGFASAALTTRRNFAWLTDGGDAHVAGATDESVAAIVVTARDVRVVTTVIEAKRLADEELGGANLAIEAAPWPDGLQPLLRELPAPVAHDADIEPELRHVRARLTAEEEERLIWLGARAARAVTEVFVATRRGDLETVIAERMALRLADDGVNAPVLLVASDERIARYRHPIPKPKRVERALLLVLCAEWRGLYVALTRQGMLSGRVEEETRKRFAASRQIEIAFNDATVPGRTLGEVFELGIEAYKRSGYPDEWRLHHQGGTIGYRGREILATPNERERVDPGMAFAWNPSVTGVKVEDTLLLQRDGRRAFVTRDDSWPLDASGAPTLWDGR
ncbi:MAG: hypothetical protein AUH85_16990 [Chloroflexi bacterium 13_1_40CM_4_68_4]|nr:MAG: hypothetical protein AUH85_16990 [Chloroflexi bacterium 13_1_40CM_4_68_4]